MQPDKEIIKLRLDIILAQANLLPDSDPRKQLKLDLVKETKQKENIRID